MQENLAAKYVILILLTLALIPIGIILFDRLTELRYKAAMTFIFLAELDAINIKRETFDIRLQDIEEYFTNGDWTMAEHWVERVRDQYEGVVREELDSRKEKHNAKS